MKIIIDCMGGDRAPLEILKGVIDAKTELGGDYLLVGNQDVLEAIAAEHGRFSDLAASAVLKNVIENDAKKGRERKILAIKVEAAKAVKAFFESGYGRRFLARMAELGIDPQSEKAVEPASTGPLAGAGCVLTGTLSRPRGEYAKLIELAGGTVQSAVTSKTKYLIAGENTGAAKTKKALELGTEVIDEAQLLKMLEGGSAGVVEAEKPEPSRKIEQGELF